jgi:hypothetical protein
VHVGKEATNILWTHDYCGTIHSRADDTVGFGTGIIQNSSSLRFDSRAAALARL